MYKILENLNNILQVLHCQLIFVSDMCSDCDTCYFNGHCYPWEKSIALIGCKGGVCTGGAGEICRGRDCRGINNII